jgi:hypothetical protein
MLWAPPSGENRWIRLRAVITTRRIVVIQYATAGPPYRVGFDGSTLDGRGIQEVGSKVLMHDL